MSRQNFIIFSISSLLLVCYLMIWFYADYVKSNLGDPSVVTGYSLFVVILSLFAFNLRKRLSFIPLLAAKYWTIFHIAAGTTGLLIYWLHTGSIWPQGAYEQILGLLFYMVSFSGIVGVLFQRLFPKRLNETGSEIIYERIPDIIAEIREKNEALILRCTSETGKGTLARHYIETLDWFFLQPRYFFNHLWGGRKGTSWIEHHFTLVRRYLSQSETDYLDELKSHAMEKNQIDFHYAAQSILKYWLFVHIPLSLAMFTFVLWHLLLVNIYAI